MDVKEALEWADDMEEKPILVIGEYSREAIQFLATEVRQLQEEVKQSKRDALCLVELSTEALIARAEAAERQLEQNSLSFHAIQEAHSDQIAELSAEVERLQKTTGDCSEGDDWTKLRDRAEAAESKLAAAREEIAKLTEMHSDLCLDTCAKNRHLAKAWADKAAALARAEAAEAARKQWEDVATEKAEYNAKLRKVVAAMLEFLRGAVRQGKAMGLDVPDVFHEAIAALAALDAEEV